MGGLFNPHGIVAANDSTVFVCDSNNHRVMKFSGTGALLLTWGTPGSQAGEFSFPWGISTAGLGRLFVADNGNNRIQVFDFEGQYLYGWTGAGTAGELRCPTALLATGSGIFVCDNCNSRVVEFNRQGGFRSTWGSFGTGPGQFGSMEGITMDLNQTIYIADTGNGRIQKFKTDGTFLSQWNAAAPGQFLARPAGLATGTGSGVSLYVTDAEDDVVHIYQYPVVAVPGDGGPGADLRPLRAFPNPTASGVELSFTVGTDQPEGVTVRALVVDASGREVRELAPGVLSPGVHRIRWDGRDSEGRDVGAGVFFVKLVQDGRAAGGTRLVRIP